jgi:hypothetical protein
MPGEFVPHGYLAWVRTWLTEERDVDAFLWALDTHKIKIEDAPPSSFDSEQEKQRVAALLAQYNQEPSAQPTPSPAPETSDEESDDEEEEPESADESASVEMTPEIDAGFAQIARERVARAPFRYYVRLPLKRAMHLWFNTHSQYWPFEGDLFVEEGDSHEPAQQVFLPAFMAMVWIYTFLGAVGAWFLWAAKDFEARRWLLLTALLIFLRLGFFATRENPEPRYVMEFFPLLATVGGIALVRVIESFKRPGIDD